MVFVQTGQMQMIRWIGVLLFVIVTVGMIAYHGKNTAEALSDNNGQIELDIKEFRDAVETGCGSGITYPSTELTHELPADIKHLWIVSSQYTAELRDDSRTGLIATQYCDSVTICRAGAGGADCPTGGELPGGQRLSLKLWYVDGNDGVVIDRIG